jgi:hypothetical protein
MLNRPIALIKTELHIFAGQNIGAKQKQVLDEFRIFKDTTNAEIVTC